MNEYLLSRIRDAIASHVDIVGPAGDPWLEETARAVYEAIDDVGWRAHVTRRSRGTLAGVRGSVTLPPQWAGRDVIVIPLKGERP